MNVRYLKWVLIALLVVANLYLGLSLFLQYRELEVVGYEEQSLVSSLLAKDGISVTTDVIPDRKPAGDIYEYPFAAEAYCKTAASRFFAYLFEEQDHFGTYIYRDGVKMLRGSLTEPADGATDTAEAVPAALAEDAERSGDASLYFSVGTGDIFGFEYRSSDRDEDSAAYVAALLDAFSGVELYSDALDFSGVIGQKAETTADPSSVGPTAEKAADLINIAALRISDGRGYRALTEQASALLTYVMNGAESGAFSTHTTGVIADQEHQVTAVLLGCRLNGVSVYGTGALLLYDSEGELLHIAGNLIFTDAARSYQSGLRDQINILYDERARLRSQESELPGAADDPDQDEPDNSETRGEGDSTVVFPWWYDETSAETEPAIRPGVSGRPDLTTPSVTEAVEAAPDTGTQEQVQNGTVPEKTVTSMEIVYCINWNTVLTKCYLIPAWKIDYADGSAVIRNAIDGGIYG